nr:hypothetical protein [Wadden Sea poxvirus]
MMNSSLFKTIPFFGFSKIRDDIITSIDITKSEYYNNMYVNFIASEIQHYIDEVISINDRIHIKIITDKTKYNYYDEYNEDFVFTKAIVCLKSTKGGLLIISNKINGNKNIIDLNTDYITLISPLATYNIAPIINGSIILTILYINIPSMRVYNVFKNNILYSTHFDTLKLLQNECMFIVKRLDDFKTKKRICDQIFINGEWYTILNTKYKKTYIPSICFGKTNIEYKYSYINIDIDSIISENFPFDIIHPKIYVYKYMIVEEKILYGKIVVDNYNE